MSSACSKSAELKAGEKMFDLGSGDGRIVIMAAQRIAPIATGVELDNDLYIQSEAKINQLGLQRTARIIHGDILKQDYSSANLITVYLLPESNLKAAPDSRRAVEERHAGCGSRFRNRRLETRQRRLPSPTTEKAAATRCSSTSIDLMRPVGRFPICPLSFRNLPHNENRHHLLSHLRRQRNRRHRARPRTRRPRARSPLHYLREPHPARSRPSPASITTKWRFPITRCFNTRPTASPWPREWRKWRKATTWICCMSTTPSRIPFRPCWRARCSGDPPAAIHHHAAWHRYHPRGRRPVVLHDHEIFH